MTVPEVQRRGQVAATGPDSAFTLAQPLAGDAPIGIQVLGDDRSLTPRMRALHPSRCSHRHDPAIHSGQRRDRLSCADDHPVGSHRGRSSGFGADSRTLGLSHGRRQQGGRLRTVVRVMGMAVLALFMAGAVVLVPSIVADPAYDLEAEGPSSHPAKYADSSDAEDLEDANQAASVPTGKVSPRPSDDGGNEVDPMSARFGVLNQSLTVAAQLGEDEESSSDHELAEFMSRLRAVGRATTGTTTAAEPEVAPEDQWVDAGNGVAVPDVLLRIRFCESTNNYRAAHSVSSARGAYQFLTGSWNWYGHAARYGVTTADQATPAQQDQAAVRTLRKSGTRPWLASRHCWASPSINPAYASIRPPATTTNDASPTTVAQTTVPPATEVETTGAETTMAESSVTQTTVTQTSVTQTTVAQTTVTQPPGTGDAAGAGQSSTSDRDKTATTSQATSSTASVSSPATATGATAVTESTTSEPGDSSAGDSSSG